MQKPHQATEPRAGMLCEQATLRVLYYLVAAYNLHRRLRRRKAAKKAACRIAALYNLSLRKDVHPMRAIIDASSDADRKTRSRWMRALQYAWRERHTWEDFRGF